MEKENNNQVMKDITEQVDNIITSLWIESVKCINDGDIGKAFNSLHSIFLAINPYNFDNKETLENHINYLDDLMANLSTNPKSGEKSRKEYYQTLATIKIELKNNLNLVTQSLKQLGKWLRVYEKQEDLHLLLSDQTYGTEETLIEKEMETLKKLSNEEMLSFFSVNSIHNAYNRWLVKNAKS